MSFLTHFRKANTLFSAEKAQPNYIHTQLQQITEQQKLFREMKLNFIQNLSEQVIRQNHQLKNEVVQLNQKISNYQQQMIPVITSISPTTLIFAQPQEIFKHFVTNIKLETKNHEVTKKQNEKLRALCDKLKVQNDSIKIDIDQKIKQLNERAAQWTKERQKLSNELFFQKEQSKNLKVANEDIKHLLNDLKVDKLKLQQDKNKQIEQMMLSHYFEQINIKSSIQKEHLKVEKQLSAEIQSKNATIKQMSEFIQKLKTFQSSEVNDTAAIQQMFRKLQKYNDLADVIVEVRAQNTELREQKKQLENNNSKLQAKIKELKFGEANLISQLQRSKIYQQQLEDKLMSKTTQLLRSLKDKQEMQKYYAERWNTQYKRVKNQLGKDLLRKIASLQEECNTKMAQMQASMNEAIQNSNVLLQRNKYLEEIYHQNQNEIIQLQQCVNILKQNIFQLKRNFRESEVMNLQDISMKKIVFNEQRKSFEQKITSLNKIIQNQREKLTYVKLQNSKKIEQLQRLFLQKLEWESKQYESDKIMLTITYEDQMRRIKQQVEKKSEYVEMMKIQFQRAYQKKLADKQAQLCQKIEQKQQEILRKEQKWVARFNQIETRSLILKKKLEEEISNLKLQVSGLQQKNLKLWQINGQMKVRMEEISKQNKALKENMFALQKQIKQLKVYIADLQIKNESLQKQLKSSRNQIDVLFQLRKQWQNQLANVQFQYKQEFESLKKQVEKQRKVLQQKITELQDMHKKTMISQRDYEELKMISQQKKELKQEMHIKQAENIILTQVKDYYQTKLKEAEQQISRCELKATHSIMARKIKKNRIKLETNTSSQKIFDQPQESNQMGETRRYAINSYRKNFHFSASKEKLEQNSNQKQFRVKTSYGY